MESSESLISEIVQIREQWAAEVGGGSRRQWPRAIRERALRLVDSGLRMRKIAERSGVPYETICQWKYQRDQKLKRFHQLPVITDEKTAITNAGTVTVTVPANESKPNERAIVVRTPDGFAVRVWTEQSAALVITSLRGGMNQCS